MDWIFGRRIGEYWTLSFTDVLVELQPVKAHRGLRMPAVPPHRAPVAKNNPIETGPEGFRIQDEAVLPGLIPLQAKLGGARIVESNAHVHFAVTGDPGGPETGCQLDWRRPAGENEENLGHRSPG